MNKINLLFVTLFGIGNLKFAPGTFASLVTSILLFIIFHVFGISSSFVLLFLLILLIYSIFAVSSCLNKFKDNDPKQIVIDEVIGQSIPIYIYEISHGTEKNFDKSILFYFFICNYCLYVFLLLNCD